MPWPGRPCFQLVSSCELLSLYTVSLPRVGAGHPHSFAWTGRPPIHWLAPCTGLAVIGLAIFPPYLAITAYMADVYEIWSSSALACQSLCRNLSVGAMVSWHPDIVTVTEAGANNFASSTTSDPRRRTSVRALPPPRWHRHGVFLRAGWHPTR